MPAEASATATVFRTGGPSEPGEAKVAILASERNLAGALFRVLRGNRVLLHGQLRRAPGSSAPWAHAYRADWSVIREPGTYRLLAAGVTSRPWLVRSRPLIFRLLGFFLTNRDGSEPALLHGPSHLNDAVVRGGAHDGERIDMTGGWMDAGDMLHFAQTTAYSAALLQAAARLAPGFADALNQEADVGIRWLLKAHPYPDLFIVQVGGPVDHRQGFRDPARDDASEVPGIGTRFAYHWGTGVGADIAGKAAAALAMAADREPNPAERAELVVAAREWYAAGKAAGRATPALPGSGGFYTFDTWLGSLAAGAAALRRVTGDPAYVREALTYLNAAKSEVHEPIGPGSLAAFAAADICGVLGASHLAGGTGRGNACRYLREGARAARDHSLRNAFAPASYFQWGTTSVNAAFGAQAALAKQAGFEPGFRIAAGARDFMFGRNAWGASFVAGFGPRSPRKIHHWASVFPPHDGLPPGAVVGGPAPRATVLGEGFRPGGPLRAFNSGVVYEDRRADYVTSEPAIDYAASSILLLAALRAR